MAHLIDFSNNRSNIAFVGEVPWHGLGQKVTEGAPIEIWAKEAGLDWTAEQARVQFEHQGLMHKGDSKILFRSDTHAQLGIVSDRYKIVQPAEVLEFYRDLVALEGWNIEVAGSLAGGKRIWALAKTGAEFRVRGSVDAVENYLLLATSFDGSMATVGKFTNVRVVCQNTLSASLSGGGAATVSVPHSAEFRPTEMKRRLGIFEESMLVFQEQADALAGEKVSDKTATRFLLDMLAGEGVDPRDLSTRTANTVKGVFDLYKGRGKGSTLPTAQDTLWGLLNAVTEHVDHYQGRSNDTRIRSAWFGQGENLKLKAKDTLLTMLAA